MRSTIIVPTSACVEGHIVRGKDDGDARRRDQCAAGHIVRGKDDCDARDHDLDIEQDHEIRREWSERRAHACGTEARRVAARGMVPQGPEDVAGKSDRVEDQHQVKQRLNLH